MQCIINMVYMPSEPYWPTVVTPPKKRGPKPKPKPIEITDFYPQIVTRRDAVEIDIDELEKLCMLQCTLAELAAFFGCSEPTIDRRAADPTFRAIMQRGYLKGKISVRRKQMQLLDGGNATMAVWLGKQLLGQRDNIDVGVHPTRLEDLPPEVL